MWVSTGAATNHIKAGSVCEEPRRMEEQGVTKSWAAVPPEYREGWPCLEACRETGEIRYAEGGGIVPASRPGPGKNPCVRMKKAKALDVRKLVAAAFTPGAEGITVRRKYGCGPEAPPALENLTIHCRHCTEETSGETYVKLEPTHPLLLRIGVEGELHVGDRGTVRDGNGEILTQRPLRSKSRDPVVSVRTQNGGRTTVYVHWLVLATAHSTASSFARIRADVPMHTDGMLSRKLEDIRSRYVGVLTNGKREAIP